MKVVIRFVLVLAVLFVAPEVTTAQSPTPTPERILEALREIDAMDTPEQKAQALSQYIVVLETLLSAESAGSDEPAQSPESQWRVSSSTDPLSDETRTVVMVRASQGRGVYGDPIGLVLRKSGDTTEAYINWASYLGMDSTTVSYRVDDGEARTKILNLSTDNKATFFGGLGTERLIRDLLDADTFVARTTPYSENPITAVFPVSGLRQVVESTPHLSNWLDFSEIPESKR